MTYPVMCVAGGFQVKDMDVGVTDVNWRPVGAGTTGLAVDGEPRQEGTDVCTSCLTHLFSTA